MLAAAALIGVLAVTPDLHPLHVWDVPPKLIKRVEPKRPKDVKARLTGIVILEIEIDEKGRVVGGVVKKPLPLGYTEAAIEAVRQWKYRPAQYRGKPKRVRYFVTINFGPDTIVQGAPEPPGRGKPQ